MQHRTMDSQSGEFPEHAVHEPTADISGIVGMIRRQIPMALLGGTLGILVALAFVLLVEPQYRATSTILLDPDRSKIVHDISGEERPTSIEEYVATQIAVLHSDIIARRVIHELGLRYDNDAERLRLLPAGEEAAADRPPVPRITSEYLAGRDIDKETIEAVQRSVTAYQVDKGLVVEIAARDPDPELSQQLANAYGAAYFADQLSARFEAVKMAGTWLEERISGLGEQALEASASAEAFRARNDLATADGRLVSDRQLEQLVQQLIAADTPVALAAARAEVFEQAVNSGDLNDIMSFISRTAELPETAPINPLMADYIGAAARARAVIARWGEDSEQATALLEETNHLADLVRREAERLLQGYRSELRVAQAHRDSIQRAVRTAMERAQADNTTLVQFRSLEQKANSYSQIYQEYLARYQEAIQQETLSLPSGRLISTAVVPTLPVFPKWKLILALALVLGASAGAAAGAIRETRDKTFRTRKDVERLGVDFIGYLAAPAAEARAEQKKQVKAPALAAKPGGSSCLFQPDADIIRKTSIALDICTRGQGRSVGFASLEPSASRSALALAYAEQEAERGRRVLLVDADASAASLSRALAADCRLGPPPSGTSEVPKEKLVRLESGVEFVPICTERGSVDPPLVPGISHLAAWRSHYDLLVVDLPVAESVSEVRVLQPALDAVVCALHWGQTPREDLHVLLRSDFGLRSKICGAILTDVVLTKLRLYDPNTALTMRLNNNIDGRPK